MSRFSWIPGLPSLGPTYDLWMIDYGAARPPSGDHDLIFLVVDDGDEAELLANRTGGPTRLDGRWLGRVDHEKVHMKLGSRRVPIKCWIVLEGDGQGTRARAVPESMLGQLPPRDPTATQIEHRYEELGL